MAALTGERDTPKRHSDFVYAFARKGNTKSYSGGMVNTDANGYAVAATDTANHHCVGRGNATSDTTATGPDGQLADGVGSQEVDVGIFEYDNPAGANQLTLADVQKLAYVLSDHEVTRAAGTAQSVIAGVVMSVDTANNKAVIDFRRKAI